MSRREHEWDGFPSENYNSCAPSRYLKQIPYAERFSPNIDWLHNNWD